MAFADEAVVIIFQNYIISYAVQQHNKQITCRSKVVQRKLEQPHYSQRRANISIRPNLQPSLNHLLTPNCTLFHSTHLTTHYFFLSIFFTAPLPPHPSTPPSKSPSNSPDLTASRPSIRDPKLPSPPISKKKLVSPTLPSMMPLPPPIIPSTATTLSRELSSNTIREAAS